MRFFLESIREELPEQLHQVLEWEIVPWALVKNRHGDHPVTPLIALLEAYLLLDDILDLNQIACASIPSEVDRCLRCGTCCTYMSPGAVSARTYRRWIEMEAPVARFYRPVARKGSVATCNCWYHGAQRLRMCPFLLQNRLDAKPFCCIHHLGREFRPRACSRFPPNPPTCQTGNFVPVP